MAKTTGALRHTHRYFKHHNAKGTVTWKCMRDGCTHYYPGNIGGEPVGMMSICWSCGKEFMLLPYNMTDNEPNCDDCLAPSDLLAQELEDKLKDINTPKMTIHEYVKRKEELQKEKDQIEVIEAEENDNE